MPEADRLGRVGRLALALGVGAAVATGWGAGIAQADTSGSANGTSAAAHHATITHKSVVKQSPTHAPAERPTPVPASARHDGDKTAHTNAAASAKVLPVVVTASVTGTPSKPKPADTPAQWSLLAFARREFEPAVLTSLTSIPKLANVFDFAERTASSLFNAAMHVIVGPPALPPGSTVTVATSTLQLPCSTSACTVPADWYFPADSNPKGIIYFQHGAISNSAMYSYTAATLAQQTDSIVVAPTLSTLYTTDGYWLGGAPMQQVVADLFVGDRTALEASAAAAAGHPVTLPQRVVLVGHSEGGGLVVGAAGDIATGSDAADLAGVIVLDGSILDRSLIATAADKLPADTPILLIASPPSYWNQLGADAADLVAARPHQFDGVQIVGGSHGDAVQGGNPLVQTIEELVAGPVKPQNADAVTTLASGWINDMLAGTHTGIYGAPGQTLDITTDAGTATATVLPAPTTPASPTNVILNAVITFATESFYHVAGTLTNLPF